MKNAYRVHITQGLRGSKKRYSVSDVKYFTRNKTSAINKAKRESFRSRQNIPKKYKLYYSAFKIK